MMRPLIEELKILWEGVEAYDCYKKQKFNLRAAFLWSIHDFMAIFARWSCHGILTCPICVEDTLCFRLKFGGKICYFDCHRCFLPEDHPFRFNRNAFKKDTIVTRGPPKRLMVRLVVGQPGQEHPLTSSLVLPILKDNWG
jgi:hypothetical protein